MKREHYRSSNELANRKSSQKSKDLVARNKRRKMMRTVFGFCFITAIAVSLFFTGVKYSAIATDAGSFESSSYSKRFKSVMVEQNDTLWDIAERNMGVGYTDINQYVSEIIEMNNLSNTEVHFGEYICVPYYG